MRSTINVSPKRSRAAAARERFGDALMVERMIQVFRDASAARHG